MTDPPPPKRRGGGGGAWRAFVHSRSHGQKLTATGLKELSSAYKALPDAEREQFALLGQKGHQVSLYG